MTVSKLWLCTLGAAAMAWSATSQPLATPSAPDGAKRPPTETVVAETCSAFTRDRDGYWTTVRTITLNGVIMTRGTTFRAGVRFGHHDLGHELQKLCGH
jgi:hypothetical protein